MDGSKWEIHGNPIKMDDWRVTIFQETSIWLKLWLILCVPWYLTVPHVSHGQVSSEDLFVSDRWDDWRPKWPSPLHSNHMLAMLMVSGVLQIKSMIIIWYYMIWYDMIIDSSLIFLSINMYRFNIGARHDKNHRHQSPGVKKWSSTSADPGVAFQRWKLVIYHQVGVFHQCGYLKIYGL